MENREPEKSNPNHRRVFYFLNILFMCMITVASLTMAVVLFVRLERLRSEKQQEGTLYTDSQIEKIRYGAAQSERNRILLEIRLDSLHILLVNRKTVHYCICYYFEEVTIV